MDELLKEEYRFFEIAAYCLKFDDADEQHEILDNVIRFYSNICTGNDDLKDKIVHQSGVLAKIKEQNKFTLCK